MLECRIPELAFAMLKLKISYLNTLITNYEIKE